MTPVSFPAHKETGRCAVCGESQKQGNHTECSGFRIFRNTTFSFFCKTVSRLNEGAREDIKTQYRNAPNVARLITILDGLQPAQGIRPRLFGELKKRVERFALASECGSIEELKEGMRGRFFSVLQHLDCADAQRRAFNEIRRPNALVKLFYLTEKEIKKRHGQDAMICRPLILLRAETLRFIASQPTDKEPPSSNRFALAG